MQEEQPSEAEGDEQRPADRAEEVLEKPLSLHEQRIGAVLAAIRASGAKRVLDLGCGEGKLLRELLRDKQFEEIVGMDVSIRTLETARDRLKLDRLPERQAARIKLIHGSLIYRDRRLEGFDVAAVVEVVEHLDPPRLSAFERAVFEFARPGTVVLTTPNREYNVTWENVGTEKLRHPDHRFEWTRQEFRDWAEGVAGRHGYSVRFLPVGPVDEALGSPTQMGVFSGMKFDDLQPGILPMQSLRLFGEADLSGIRSGVDVFGASCYSGWTCPTGHATAVVGPFARSMNGRLGRHLVNVEIPRIIRGRQRSISLEHAGQLRGVDGVSMRS